MRLTIVTTFRGGNLNIGDRLITRSTEAALRHLFGNDIEVNIVFRAEEWETAKHKINRSDFIVFACLALRRNMRKYYRYLDEVIKSGVPYGILSAGTSLNVSGAALNYVKAFDADDKKILNELAEDSLFFTTRGVLTQAACKDLGIDKAVMVGDVAFFDDRYSDKRFGDRKDIRRIAISDPHYTVHYKDSFFRLVRSLRELLPSTSHELLLHGISDEAKSWAIELGMPVHEIYKDSENGLSTYDDFDVHIGYRVHGFVSALTRRKPSYLIEQDGRGSDYGLTVHRKITVPNYRPAKSNDVAQASVMPVDILMAMLREDLVTSFERFHGLEAQVRQFSDGNLRVLAGIESTLVR